GQGARSAECNESSAGRLEIRRPKAENRKKAEIRGPKCEDSTTCFHAGIGATSGFGLRIAFGLRYSGFGFHAGSKQTQRTCVTRGTALFWRANFIVACSALLLHGLVLD